MPSVDSPWRMLLRLAGPGRVLLAFALIFVVGLTEGIGLLMLVPILEALEPGRTPSGLLGRFMPAGADASLGLLLTVFVALVAVRVAAAGWRRILTTQLTARIVDGLRARALSALLNADWRYLASLKQAENRALLITSVDRVWQVVEQGMTMAATAVNLAMLGGAALILSWEVALGALLVGSVVLILYARIRSSAGQLGKALGRAYGTIHSRLEESLGAVRLYKSYGNEGLGLDSARHAFADLRKAEFSFVVQSTLARSAVQLGGAALLALLIWLAVDRWNAAPIVLLPLVALCARALPQLQTLQEATQFYAHARPALDEISQLIAEVESRAEPTDAGQTPPRLDQAIRLEQVNFTFAGGRAALHDIDLDIAAGSTVALLGHSGAGKSTLADILGGLLAPDSGQVLIDGQPLDAATRRAWRRNVAYMQQEAVLFAGTVRDNLLWARADADEAALRRALERAAAQFAYALPGGLDCDLGEGGRQLSGGERQRIALARALLREPRLLILDEATSAIDAAAEREVAAAVEQLKGSLTIVIIGHRGLLTQLADHQVMLHQGRVAGSG